MRRSGLETVESVSGENYGTATVNVPAASAKAVQSGPELKPLRFENGATMYEIGSGDYEFSVTSGG